MEITKDIYKNQEFIDRFEKDWAKITSTEHIKWMEECYDFFIIDKRKLDEADKGLSFVYKKSPFQQLIDSLDCGISKAKKDLIKIIDVINEYKNTTVDLLSNDYNMTLTELSLILDLDETYISRMLLEKYFKSFSMNYLARLAIKKDSKYNEVFSTAFLNKKVFIERKSVNDFLLNHLKYTEERVQINFHFDSNNIKTLKQYYPEYKEFKKAVNFVIAKVEENYNHQSKIIKKIPIESSKYFTKTGKVKREYEESFDINQSLIDEIINRKIDMISIKTIKDRLKKERNFVGLKATNASISPSLFEVQSVNDTQIYYLLSKCISFKRLILKDVTRLNSKTGEEDNIKYVRYITDIDSVIEEFFNNTKNIITDEEKNNFLYKCSLNSIAYKYITNGAIGDAAIQNAINQFFVDELVKIAQNNN